MPPTYDDYLKTLRPKKRYNLRRDARKLESEHQARFEKITEPDQVRSFLDQFEQVYRRSWQGNLHTGRSWNAEVTNRADCYRIAQLGWLRSYVLKVGDAPIAAVFGCQYEGAYHVRELCFDPKWADCGPGSVLMHLLIEDLYQQNPPQVLDFGPGDEAYKRSFRSNVEQDVAFLYLLPRNRWRLLFEAQEKMKVVYPRVRRGCWHSRLDGVGRKTAKGLHRRRTPPHRVWPQAAGLRSAKLRCRCFPPSFPFITAPSWRLRPSNRPWPRSATTRKSSLSTTAAPTIRPKPLARYGDRIRVLRQENLGPGPARNLGIQHATGQYVTFLDSDDLWFPWTLRMYREAIQRYQEPSFVAGRAVEIPHDQWVTASSNRSARHGADPAAKLYRDYLSASREVDWIGTCAVAIRADWLRKVGGFPDEHVNAEDSDLWLRLGEAPGFVSVLNPPLFVYRRQAASAAHESRQKFCRHRMAGSVRARSFVSRRRSPPPPALGGAHPPHSPAVAGLPARRAFALGLAALSQFVPVEPPAASG